MVKQALGFIHYTHKRHVVNSPLNVLIESCGRKLVLQAGPIELLKEAASFGIVLPGSIKQGKERYQKFHTKSAHVDAEYFYGT
jgi:hypothetical protein